MALYFGDFFVHPLMNNENALIVDKLPFHLCTSACILIGITRNWRTKFSLFYPSVVLLGLIGSLGYLVAPIGVTDNALFCYRTLQTLIYHSLLFIFGVLSIVYDDIKPGFRTLSVLSPIVAVQIVISVLANTVYSTEDHHYDWYFSTGSTFGFSETVMPFLVFAVLVFLSALVIGITLLCRKKKPNAKTKR